MSAGKRRKASKKPTKPAPFWSDDWLRYAMLIVCVVSQVATIIITRPLWEARTSPPPLPLFPLPAAPFTLIILASLIPVLIRPKWGVPIHAVVYTVSCVLDQTRVQPQFFTPVILMAAAAYEQGPRMGRWYLAAMWIWSGLHKFLSPDWWGHISWSLLDGLPFPATQHHVAIGAVVAGSEIALGLLAIFRPRLAAIPAVALHGGIAIFLSPLIADNNYSVIPWNIAMAIVGCWILTRTFPKSSSWELVAAAVLLLAPAGFYLGWVHLYFAHSLYSGNAPRAMITQVDGAQETIGWGEAAVPIPHERLLLVQHFEATASPGDKMHLHDPRPWLDDAFFVLNESGVAQRIDRDAFRGEKIGAVAGYEIEDANVLLELAKAGARMSRRKEGAPITGIVFAPEHFQASQLELASRLPNIEEIVLDGTSVRDEDLANLKAFHRLVGISVEQTEISDAGLTHLADMPHLRIVKHEGSKITDDGMKRLGVVP